MPIFFGAKTYNISSALVCRKANVWIGAGRGQVSAAANPSDGATVLKATASMAHILLIQSAVSGEYIYSPVVDGFVFDGNNLAAAGLVAGSMSHGVFNNILCLKCTEAGLILTDSNDAISLHNKIPDYQYNSGANVAAENSHGIYLKDASSAASQKGVVQTDIGNVATYTVNGDGIRIRGADNNTIRKLQGYVTGIGKGLYFANGLSVNARNNLIHYMSGTVHAENGTYGNRIKHLISEASGVTMDAGAILHYDVENYIGSGVFETHKFAMSDKLRVASSAIEPDGVVAVRGIQASQWDCIDFPDSNTGKARFNVPIPYRWGDGGIESIKLIYSTDTANTSADARIRLNLSSLAVGEATATPQHNQAFTVRVNDAANRVNEFEAILSAPLTFGHAETVVCRVEREPLDALDTAVGLFQLIGVEVKYKGNGPAGGFDVSEPGS